MALKIRLARGGAKKRPYYHIVISDARSPRDGKYLEKVGSYNPMLAKEDENRIKLQADRITHWVKMGAKPTDRVHRFLSDAGLFQKYVQTMQTKRHLPGEKAVERAKEIAAKQATQNLAPGVENLATSS